MMDGAWLDEDGSRYPYWLSGATDGRRGLSLGLFEAVEAFFERMEA
jgi:hypothetical protein